MDMKKWTNFVISLNLHYRYSWTFIVEVTLPSILPIYISLLSTIFSILLNISLFTFQIKYHEDFEKQKGKLITIADDPELQRIKQNTQIQSEISYKGIKQTRDFMEQRRPDQAAQGNTYYFFLFSTMHFCF